jgi:two-component sensor histidine kinase
MSCGASKLMLKELEPAGRAETSDRIRALEELLVAKDQELRESNQRFQEFHHRVMNELAGLNLHQLSQWQTSGQPGHCSACIARLDATIELYRLLDRVSIGREHKTMRMAPYLRTIAQTIERAFASNVKIETSFDPLVSLRRERASLVGLVLHEAIINALKYAFPGGQRGTVRVEFRPVGKVCELLVVDDGIGFDPMTVKQGVGTQVMHHLARQLNGTIQYLRVPKGTVLRLGFLA